MLANKTCTQSAVMANKPSHTHKEIERHIKNIDAAKLEIKRLQKQIATWRLMVDKLMDRAEIEKMQAQHLTRRKKGVQ